MPRILVAGELNADLILTGLPSLPVLGRELVGTGFALVLGSSSAITAARLAALGAENPDYAVDFVGLVGDDEMGRFVLNQLQHFGVQTEAIQTTDTPTGITVALTYARDRALLTIPGTIATFDGTTITGDLLARYSHLHVGSFFLQTALQPHLAEIFQRANNQGVTTSLDVGWDPAEAWMNNPHLAAVLAHTDAFLPNEDEAAALAPSAERLKAMVKGVLLVKRGAQGASAYVAEADGTLAVVDLPAVPVEPVDTTGAGDAFNAGYIYARHVLGESFEAALDVAVRCGAQATLHVGGATAAPTEQMIRQWRAD